MKHAVALSLVGAFLALGWLRGETFFLTVAAACAVGYGFSLWAWRKRR